MNVFMFTEVTFLDLGKDLPELQTSRLSKSPLCSTSFESNLIAVNFKTGLRFGGREEAADCDVPADGQIAERVEKESCDRTEGELHQGSGEELPPSAPQFCFKHQRWVKTILQECPEDLPVDGSLSPPLFQSSSSRTSSQDLTPSDLVPWQRPASDAPAAPQAPEQTAERANSQDQTTSGSSPSSGLASESQPWLRPAPFRDAQVPVLPLEVQVIDSVSVGGPEQNGSSAAHRHRSSFPSNRALSCLPNWARLREVALNPPEKVDPGSRGLSAGKITHCPSSSGGHRDASTSPSITKSSQANVPVFSIQHPGAGTAVQRTLSRRGAQTGDSHGNRLGRALLRLSLPSQAVLLQSKLLQPRVSLSRLSSQHCHRATRGRSAGLSDEDKVTGTKAEGDGDSSFDLNRLYSSRSSSSGGEDSTLWDPDYKPSVNRPKLFNFGKYGKSS